MTILSKIHVYYKHLFKGNPVLPSSGQHSSDYKLYMKTTFVSVYSCLLIKMQTKKTKNQKKTKKKKKKKGGKKEKKEKGGRGGGGGGGGGVSKAKKDFFAASLIRTKCSYRR